MVAAELAVVTALVVVAWNVVASANRSVPIVPVIQAPDVTSDPSSPLPQVPDVNRHASRGPLPSLNLDSAFWRDRLAQLNADQMELARLEWQLVHSAMAAAQHYVETVVLPAVHRAEQGGGALVL